MKSFGMAAAIALFIGLLTLPLQAGKALAQGGSQGGNKTFGSTFGSVTLYGCLLSEPYVAPAPPSQQAVGPAPNWAQDGVYYPSLWYGPPSASTYGPGPYAYPLYGANPWLQYPSQGYWSAWYPSWPASAAGQTEGPPPLPPSPTPTPPPTEPNRPNRLSATLYELYVAQAQGTLEARARSLNVPLVEGRVQVLIQTMPGQREAAAGAVLALGGTGLQPLITADYFGAWVPVTALVAVAQTPTVALVNTPTTYTTYTSH